MMIGTGGGVNVGRILVFETDVGMGMMDNSAGARRRVVVWVLSERGDGLKWV